MTMYVLPISDRNHHNTLNTANYCRLNHSNHILLTIGSFGVEERENTINATALNSEDSNARYRKRRNFRMR